MSAILNEGLKKLYSGTNWKDKQVTLFSIIGIISIAGAYIYLGQNDFMTISSSSIWLVLALDVLWTVYFAGYEIKYLNNILNNKSDILPEFDAEPFKIVVGIFPLIVIIINSALTILSLQPNKEKLIFLISVIVCFFVTIFQIGYSKEYKNTDITSVYKVLEINDYLKFLFKRFLVVINAFLISYGIVFGVMLIAGIIFLITGFVNTQSFTDIVFSAQSSQLALTKLAIYSTTVLLNYFVTIGLLGWDYELSQKYLEKLSLHN